MDSSANTTSHEPITARVDMAVRGMTCASCVARVEKKLNKVDGIAAVVNLATERAHVELRGPSGDLSNDDLVAIVKRAGYDASIIQRTELCADGSQQQTQANEGDIEALMEAAARARVHDLWRRFRVCAAISVPIIALSMIPALQFTGWQYAVALASLPVAIWGGWPFHRAAFQAARHGSSTMDTLVSLGVITAMGWSLWTLATTHARHLGYTMRMSGIHGITEDHHPHLYFESAAMIITFLLIGRWLEARSRRHAGDALRALLRLGVAEVYLLTRADGTTANTTISTRDLRVGDIFRVLPGQSIATDGVVVSGESAVDASLVTGESLPINVAPGSSVIGATMNTHGSLDVQATRVGEETTLAQMGRLLTQAQTGKAPVQRIADRISAVFVPGVLLIAAITFAIRLILMHNSAQAAVASAITVLVVACPCALGLATPTALLVGSGRLSRLGVLIRGPEVLEAAHHLDTIVFDKTGTLTTGQMRVDDVMFFPESPSQDQPLSQIDSAHTLASDLSAPLNHTQLLAIAAGCEAHSEHPLARAIVEHTQAQHINVQPVNEFRNHAGHGISARLAQGASVLIGRLEWLASQGVDVNSADTAQVHERAIGASIVAMAVDTHLRAVFFIRDTVRDHANETITHLASAGLRPYLVTGDNPASAQAVAAKVGIENVHAGVLPSDKVRIVDELQRAGLRVAMIGDGVNDAAALAAADLSIAMGSGADVAKAAADITIVNSDIRTLPESLRISRATLRIIRENLLWAFGYNLIAIPTAAAGIILPGLAALAMASSSIIVVLNSLRLRSI
ncbi:heavy metal translocating P-type ATPase [Trueperella sp. LYQ143]|uniref:heavy metal translocating P-type ATPase n=1 Tax=Trueperella sp. LYQ143 TaxID=3391059 RepID=UPI00398313DE